MLNSLFYRKKKISDRVMISEIAFESQSSGSVSTWSLQNIHDLPSRPFQSSGWFAIVLLAFPYDRPDRLNIFETIWTIIWKPETSQNFPFHRGPPRVVRNFCGSGIFCRPGFSGWVSIFVFFRKLRLFKWIRSTRFYMRGSWIIRQWSKFSAGTFVADRGKNRKNYWN